MLAKVVSFAPLLGSSRNTPPQLTSWGGALRDDPNNGCEGDYRESGCNWLLRFRIRPKLQPKRSSVMQESTKSVQVTREFANSNELDGLLPRKGERSSESRPEAPS